MRRDKKNLVPLFFLMVLFWGMLVAMVVLVDPFVLKDFPIENSYSLFFVVVFLAIFFLLSLVIGSARRGLIYSVGIVIFLGLRLIRLGNVVNGALLFGLVMAIDYYFENR